MSLLTKIKSFLKAAEADAAGFLKEAAKVEPIVVGVGEAVSDAAGKPEIAAAISKIGAVVVGAGALVTTVAGTAGTGASKLAIAAPLVEQLITGSGFLSTRAIADVAKWKSAISVLTGAVADLFDATTASTAPAAPAAATTESGVKA
jgi:hypothetical protein